MSELLYIDAHSVFGERTKIDFFSNPFVTIGYVVRRLLSLGAFMVRSNEWN